METIVIILVVAVIIIVVFTMVNSNSQNKAKPANTKTTSKLDELNSIVEDDKNLNILKDIGGIMQSMSSDGTDLDIMPEGFGEFGLEETNPVPVNTIFGSKTYLRNLRTEANEEVEFSRIGSTSASNISMPIDTYEIKVNGSIVSKIYICPYNKKNSNKAPKGFKLIN